MVDSHSLWYVDRVLTRRFEWLLLVTVFAFAAVVSSGLWSNAAVDAHIQHLMADLDAGGTARAKATTELMRWGPSARAAVPALIAHQSEDLLALNALIRIGPGAATGALIQTLEGKDKKAAAFAAQVLAFYGPAAAAARPALLRAASDAELKYAAADALRAVDGEVDLTEELQRR